MIQAVQKLFSDCVRAWRRSPWMPYARGGIVSLDMATGRDFTSFSVVPLRAQIFKTFAVPPEILGSNDTIKMDTRHLQAVHALDRTSFSMHQAATALRHLAAVGFSSGPPYYHRRRPVNWDAELFHLVKKNEQEEN